MHSASFDLLGPSNVFLYFSFWQTWSYSHALCHDGTVPCFSFKQLLFCNLSIYISFTAILCFLFIGFSVRWSLFLIPSDFKEGKESMGFQAPWRSERERGHKPLQFISHEKSRKTSERFRTQPVTSAEHQETHRYCMGYTEERWTMVTII